MSVLVTGGAGYIGSHFVLALLDRGEQVVVLDDLSTGQRSAVPQAVAFVEGDVADAALVIETIRAHAVDTVAHFAAKIVVPESVAHPLAYYLANTAKTRSLLQSVVDCGIDKFIFSSTAAVYGNSDTETVSEDAVLAPASPYGRSKLMSEWMLRDCGPAYGLRSVILRYFNVAGADPAGRAGQSFAEGTHLIKVAMQAALGRRSHMEIFGDDYPTRDGTGLRDYIHVSDLAEAHVLALDHLREGGESLTLNCGYGNGVSVREVVDTIRKVSGTDFEVRMSPRRPGDPAAVVANPGQIRERLGWRPRHDDLETIIRQALAWERGLPH
jgi:UDP-glucose 4-epimerase